VLSDPGVPGLAALDDAGVTEQVVNRGGWLLQFGRLGQAAILLSDGLGIGYGWSARERPGKA
jgi:hypothetical protein